VDLENIGNLAALFYELSIDSGELFTGLISVDFSDPGHRLTLPLKASKENDRRQYGRCRLRSL
jgi:hypothetical protein